MAAAPGEPPLASAAALRSPAVVGRPVPVALVAPLLLASGACALADQTGWWPSWR